MSLIDDNGDMREDIQVPEGELGEEIKVGTRCSTVNKKKIDKSIDFLRGWEEKNGFHFSFEELWASWGESGAEWGPFWDLYLR